MGRPARRDTQAAVVTVPGRAGIRGTEACLAVGIAGPRCNEYDEIWYLGVTASMEECQKLAKAFGDLKNMKRSGPTAPRVPIPSAGRAGARALCLPPALDLPSG